MDTNEFDQEEHRQRLFEAKWEKFKMFKDQNRPEEFWKAWNELKEIMKTMEEKDLSDF